jgi:hypothetical protein
LTRAGTTTRGSASTWASASIAVRRTLALELVARRRKVGMPVLSEIHHPSANSFSGSGSRTSCAGRRCN